MGLYHIIQKKLKDKSAAKSPAFDLIIGKAHWHIGVHDIVGRDKTRIFHCFGKTVAFGIAYRRTGEIRGIHPEILPADIFIAGFSGVATEIAAFVT